MHYRYIPQLTEVSSRNPLHSLTFSSANTLALIQVVGWPFLHLRRFHMMFPTDMWQKRFTTLLSAVWSLVCSLKKKTSRYWWAICTCAAFPHTRGFGSIEINMQHRISIDIILYHTTISYHIPIWKSVHYNDSPPWIKPNFPYHTTIPCEKPRETSHPALAAPDQVHSSILGRLYLCHRARLSTLW